MSYNIFSAISVFLLKKHLKNTVTFCFVMTKVIKYFILRQKWDNFFDISISLLFQAQEI
jgi:hypothetical protein